MNIPLIITFVGPDRAGLVSALSDAVAAHDGNWLESRLARLAGQFAGVVRADAPQERAQALEAALTALPGLSVTVTRGGAAGEAAKRRLQLDLLGLDRPGIVRDATRALSALGVNIAEFESDLRPAPFSGAQMFHARAVLEAPEAISLDAVRAALEGLAGELTAEFPADAPGPRGVTLASD
ncbi:MAG: glycine cleavage system protein R [Pseudomonadota bacterium]|nr:glycine cleavage system protein R [Pseudomonadota bacterium]